MDFNSRMKGNRKTQEELRNSHFRDSPESAKPSKPLLFRKATEEQLQATRLEMKRQNRRELMIMLAIGLTIILSVVGLWVFGFST